MKPVLSNKVGIINEHKKFVISSFPFFTLLATQLLCISRLDTMENLGIYETYMYFAQIPGIGKNINKISMDSMFTDKII